MLGVSRDHVAVAKQSLTGGAAVDPSLIGELHDHRDAAAAAPAS